MARLDVVLADASHAVELVRIRTSMAPPRCSRRREQGREQRRGGAAPLAS
jgi:hypothetical protein